MKAVAAAPKNLLQSSLLRNSYALMANSGVTAVLGIAFWFVAARWCSQEAIGLGGTVISTIIYLSNVSQLNFGNVLIRFLPGAGARAGKLILFAYGIGILASVLFASGFLLVTDRFVPELDLLTDSPVLAVLFISAVATWTVFALQDNALSGQRQSIWVTISKTGYSLLKIALLVPLAAAAWDWMAIVAAWMAPIILFILGVNWLIFGRLLPGQSSRKVVPEIIDRRSMIRFYGFDYAGSVFMMIAWVVTPVFVLNHAGAAASASFYIAWTIFTSLNSLGSAMGMSLLAEGAVDRHRLRSLAADAIVFSALPLLICVSLVVLFAPLIMGLFGPSYAAEGTATLRMLALASLLSGFVAIYSSIARAKGWMASVAIVDFFILVLSLGIGFLLIDRFGPLGMGIAWFAAYLCVFCVIIVAAILMSRAHDILGGPLAVISSIRGLIANFFPNQNQQSVSAELEAEVTSILRNAEIPNSERWRSLRTEAESNGILSIHIGDPGELSSSPGDRGRPENTSAVAKVAFSREGAEFLKQMVRRVGQLRADPRLAELTLQLPSVVAAKQSGAAFHVLEISKPGRDGRIVLNDAELRMPAFAAAAKSISLIHARTARRTVIDQQWLDDWIGLPSRILSEAVRTFLPFKRRHAAIEAFKEEQFRYWNGREFDLGWCHGNLSPATLSFQKCTEPAKHNKRTGTIDIAVSGILDWGHARALAPSALDLCHLGLTTRMLIRGEEFGATVADFIVDPRWQPEELSALQEVQYGALGEADWLADPAAAKTLVGFTWLHHISTSIQGFSGFVGSRIWVASNVDRVLRTYLAERAKK